jgi:hypothetical protein
MDPQHIIDICEGNWDANKSDCNHFVKAVADALGLTLFSAGDNADAIMDKLANAVGWAVIPSSTDLSAVENDASAGHFIIAGLKSADFTPPRNNGHVVVVVKGDDSAHPGFPLAYWGKLGGVGAKDSSIRNTFIPDVDLPNVKYYGTVLPDITDAFLTTRLATSAPDTLGAAVSSVESLIATVVESLGKPTENRLFFPNGIEKIEIEIKAGTVEVSVKVGGPKAINSTD